MSRASYARVQATVGVGTVLIWYFGIAYTRDGGTIVPTPLHHLGDYLRMQHEVNGKAVIHDVATFHHLAFGIWSPSQHPQPLLHLNLISNMPEWIAGHCPPN